MQPHNGFPKPVLNAIPSRQCSTLSRKAFITQQPPINAVICRSKACCRIHDRPDPSNSLNAVPSVSIGHCSSSIHFLAKPPVLCLNHFVLSTISRGVALISRAPGSSAIAAQRPELLVSKPFDDFRLSSDRPCGILSF
ncbi:hypothetical protein RJ55_06130 [Drechmeria coniospora]|nr:hypothetical protein RJ55_06130 [Drechmeria coniospora]